jgi:hypothetical protein
MCRSQVNLEIRRLPASRSLSSNVSIRSNQNSIREDHTFEHCQNVLNNSNEKNNGWARLLSSLCFLSPLGTCRNSERTITGR